MKSISFFSSINYQDKNLQLYNYAENFFAWGKEILVIHRDGITAAIKKNTTSSLSTLLKVALCITLIIPLVLLTIRTLHRLRLKPLVWTAIPSSNKQVRNKMHQLLKMNAFFWLPHPALERGDQSHFPEDRINFCNMNKAKDLAVWLGPEKVQKLLRQFMKKETPGNHFFAWLNSKRESFFTDAEHYYLNCSDFIYLTLYEAKLLSKKEIIEIYKNHIQAQLQNKPLNTLFGFNLDLFEDFNPSKNTLKPGDLLIGYIDKEPAHFLFLSGKNLLTQEWQGIGLWNMTDGAPIVTNTDLNELQKKCRQNNQNLSFKYCPLQNALSNIHQNFEHRALYTESSSRIGRWLGDASHLRQAKLLAKQPMFKNIGDADSLEGDGYSTTPEPMLESRAV